MRNLGFIRKTQYTHWIGEVYLIISVLGYWGLTKTFVNPVAIALLAILMILMWRKNAILGWIIGMTLLLFNLYMMFALIGELSEFPEFNSRAMEFLAGGAVYLGFNFYVSMLLLLKWGRRLG